jgi:hypothetical protein
MYDKFFDLKADAIEERRERIKLGEVAHYCKLKHDKGYIVYSMSREVFAKLFPKEAVIKFKKDEGQTP